MLVYGVLTGSGCEVRAGAEVLLDEVVDIREKKGFSRITREDGKRIVAVTAQTDKAVTNNNKVLEALKLSLIHI